MTDAGPAGGVALDALFRANAAARPETVAVADPPDRARFTDGAARRLTYAEADAAIETLANRLRALALPEGGIVAVQLPNIAESVLALLAVLRAGLVAAPVPMLWRRSDLVTALKPLGPKAFVTLARFDDERPAETACEVALDLFSLSFPCAFGADPPDGVLPLDRNDPVAAALLPTPAVSSSDRATIATFDAVPSGFFAAGRGDSEWLVAGLATLLEARIGTGDTIVSTLPLNSLAGIGAAFVPWLLSGGTLELVHGYAPDAVAVAGGARSHLVAPAAALPELAARRILPFRSCIAVHRGARTRARDFAALPAELVVDLFSFGEFGFAAMARAAKRHALPIPAGPLTAPSGSAGGAVTLEIRLRDGEIRLRGAMLPRLPFPAERAASPVEVDEDGFVRTGWRGASDGDGGILVQGGPERVVALGGLRFGLDDLRSRLAECGAGVKLAAVEDPLLGERLQIDAENPEAAAAALRAAGHSRLVIEAAAAAKPRHPAAA